MCQLPCNSYSDTPDTLRHTTTTVSGVPHLTESGDNTTSQTTSAATTTMDQIDPTIANTNNNQRIPIRIEKRYSLDSLEEVNKSFVLCIDLEHAIGAVGNQ